MIKSKLEGRGTVERAGDQSWSRLRVEFRLISTARKFWSRTSYFSHLPRYQRNEAVYERRSDNGIEAGSNHPVRKTTRFNQSGVPKSGTNDGDQRGGLAAGFDSNMN